MSSRQSSASTSLSAWDLYRRIPADLTAGTSQGGLLSVGCVFIMVVLIFMETWHYMSPPVVSDLYLDTNTEPRIRISFNITALDMPCQWVSVDVKDKLGVNRIDVAQNILKMSLSQNEMVFKGPPKEIKHDPMSNSKQSMDADNDSPHLNPAQLEKVLADKKYVFVNFYAPRCIWCARLAPTWEAFAKKLHDEHYHVAVRKVNCEAEFALCRSSRIMAFPTMRLFIDGKPTADFNGDRTIEALTSWSSRITGEDKVPHSAEVPVVGQNQEHAGCRIVGFLDVNRVPGNFHLNVKSDLHTINVKETNVSHYIHNLYFGEALPSALINKLPNRYKRMTSPLNGKKFLSDEPHTTFEHHIKVVSTNYQLTWAEVAGYQIQHTNHMYLIDEQRSPDDREGVPEARFSYELSPTAVAIRYGGRRWYEFITNLCAIIGGVFTVMGLLDRSIHGLWSKLHKV